MDTAGSDELCLGDWGSLGLVIEDGWGLNYCLVVEEVGFVTTYLWKREHYEQRSGSEESGGCVGTMKQFAVIL